MASCKKCKKEIPDGALYCQWCGAAQKKNPKNMKNVKIKWQLFSSFCRKIIDFITFRLLQ